jgi:leucine dehydrogenase
MEIFDVMGEHNHEQIVFGFDKDVGLRAIIAIHNTALGPALGGTRMWPYKSTEDALTDALRLSRGMTYKAAACGLSLGGGKGVIIGDPERDKSEVLFRDYGRLVDGLHGRFITGEDVGVGVSDIEWMRAETKYVVGISEALGGGGDPSPVTARGVVFAMKACALEVFQRQSLHGLKVMIQGLGQVGMHLAEFLHQEQAELLVADLDERRVLLAVDKFNATPVGVDEVYGADADIFAPCALGAIVNDETIPKFRVKIICGAANNQLADEKVHGLALKDFEILYAPDYVANAGGLINVANELEGYSRDRAFQQVRAIYDTVRELIEVSKSEDIPTNIASNRVAERRIDQIAKLRRTFVTEPSASYQEGRVFH